MKTVAENVVAADRLKPVEEQEYAGVTVNDTNYFPIASLDRLGLTQPAQFQSQEQDGYTWYSHLNENGEPITGNGSVADNPSTSTARYFEQLGLWVEHNSRSAMPRSYTYNIYQYYNWYAATSESGTYSMSSGFAADSICPSGWQLPSKSSDKSYDKVFRDYYPEFINPDQNGYLSIYLTKLPFSLSMTSYVLLRGQFDTSRYGTDSWWWANSAYDTYQANNFSIGLTNGNKYNYSKQAGWSVRCVIKADMTSI